MPISDYHVVGDASLAPSVPAKKPASSIGYDNTSSGMSATDVQEAIDELASGSGGGAVTGVKGDSESTYRTGNVNITKDNIGLGNVPNVTTDNQTPTVSEASSRVNLASGDTLATIVGKIKKFFSDLKTVAFTGSYSDLTDKPTIPTVNNATLTIQKNGTQVQTFTANQSTNATANITVPTKTSDLTNDSGFITSDSDEKVKQTNTTTNADYRVLFSENANDTTQTVGARKNTSFKYNPSTGNLQVTKLNGVTIGSSPKFTDTTTGTTYAAGSCPANTTFATNGSVKNAYDELNSNMTKNKWGTMVSYTSAGTYTFPSDGYVYNESSTAVSGYICGSNNNSPGLYLYPRLRVFVKKGMRYVYQNTSCVSGFIPLE